MLGGPETINADINLGPLALLWSYGAVEDIRHYRDCFGEENN